MLNLLREIIHSPVLLVLIHLRQSGGMAVNELSGLMGMSYMGVKQHCTELEKKRLVDTWRRPKATGRPEKIYRLTKRALDLFPQAGNALTVDLLERAEVVFGETAAQKLLFSHFQERTQRWARRIGQGSIEERLKHLQRERLDEGYLCGWRQEGEVIEWIDHHHPFGELVAAFPIILDLEREGMEAVLELPVTQSLEEVGQLQRVVYRLPMASSGQAN